MVRLPDKPKLDYVKFTRSKGILYAYFDTGRKKANGARIYLRMPPFGTAEFYASYGAMKGARTKRQQTVETVASVAERYQRSDEWKALKPGSQKAYRSTLKKVLDAFGDFPLADVTRSYVLQEAETFKGGATRNLFISVISVLFRFARYRELTDAEPTKDIRSYKTGEHMPWPRPLLDAALEAEDDTVRLAVHLLYFTGQRIGDVCRMRWSDIDRSGRIEVKQAKTDKSLKIHQHKDLRAELAKTPKAGLTILAKPNGRTWSADTILKKLQAFAEGQRAGRVVAHGLRKNAVIALLEAGATIPEVQAVTGQSVEMVMHYAAEVDQVRLGEAAILKLERNA